MSRQLVPAVFITHRLVSSLKSASLLSYFFPPPFFFPKSLYLWHFNKSERSIFIVPHRFLMQFAGPSFCRHKHGDGMGHHLSYAIAPRPGDGAWLTGTLCCTHRRSAELCWWHTFLNSSRHIRNSELSVQSFVWRCHDNRWQRGLWWVLFSFFFPSKNKYCRNTTVMMKLHVFTSMTQFDLLNFQNGYRKYIKWLQTPGRDFKAGRQEKVYCFTYNLNIFLVEISERQ